MADINFKQPKVFSWQEQIEEQRKNELGQPLFHGSLQVDVREDTGIPSMGDEGQKSDEGGLWYIATKAVITPQPTQTPVVDKKLVQRSELVSGARISSSVPTIADGKPAQKLRVELKFADGITTHAVDLVIAKDTYDSFDDDIECLKSALNSSFTIN